MAIAQASTFGSRVILDVRLMTALGHWRVGEI